MTLIESLKKLFKSSDKNVSEQLVVDVKVAGSVANSIQKEVAENAFSLTLRGEIDGDDLTYIHKAFKSLEELNLADAIIKCGRFVCGKHKNYYDIADDELSGHSLHIGNIKRVVLPRNMKYVELSKFNSLNFGACDDGVELTSQSGAFASCLESISVPEENSYFSSYDGVLYNKDKTELLKCPVSHSSDISFPPTLKRISENAFRGCRFVSRLEMPEGVEEIGDDAFFGCESLKELSLPNSLKHLGYDTFSHCFSLEKLACGFAEPIKLELSRRTNISDCQLEVPHGSESKFASARYWADFKKIKSL